MRLWIALLALSTVSACKEPADERLLGFNPFSRYAEPDQMVHVCRQDSDQARSICLTYIYGIVMASNGEQIAKTGKPLYCQSTDFDADSLRIQILASWQGDAQITSADDKAFEYALARAMPCP